MRRGQFWLLASLMMVTSLLGGAVASVIVSRTATEVVETPALYLVDGNHQRIGAIGISKDGLVQISRFGRAPRSESAPDAAEE
jgi:hypothetical protein